MDLSSSGRHYNVLSRFLSVGAAAIAKHYSEQITNYAKRMSSNEEFPDCGQIRGLALVGLPEGYRLLDVRCSSGSLHPLVEADDFEIVIEYATDAETADLATIKAIERYQAWAHALVQDIRSEWPAESLRISFAHRITDE